MMVNNKEETMNKKIRMICAMSTFTLAAFSFSAFAAGPISKDEVAELLGGVSWRAASAPADFVRSASLAAVDVCVLPYRDGVSLRHGSLHACLGHGRAIVATQPAVWASATPEGAPPTAATTVTQAAPPTATVASPTDTPELPTPSPTEDLEAALLEAAYRFQDAKAASQRSGDTSQLSQDLTGDALERQIELVERWRDQGCYWEISLNAPLTVTILEMRGPDAALIEVAKVETRLLYCDDELESETRNDAYTTTYLMQRIDGRWYTAERE